MVMKGITNLILFLIGCYLSDIQLLSQEKIHVIEKHFEFEQPTVSLKKLYINVEKSTVSIQTWKQPLIKGKVIFMAKHKELELAQEEILFLDLKTAPNKGVFYIRTLLSLPRGRQSPRAALSYHIQLTIPEDLNLELICKLGKIDINGGSMEVSMNTHLTQLSIDKARLSGIIHQEFGSLSMTQSNFNGSLQQYRTISHFKDVVGNLSITGESGKWSFEGDRHELTTTIQTQRTDLSYEYPSTATTHFEIKSAELKVDTNVGFQPIKIGDHHYRLGPKNPQNKVIITNTGGTVKIHTKNP